MTKKKRPVAVVVNTGDQNGYGVVSNLGKKGIRVLSVDSNLKNVTFFSKYVEKKICPDYKINEDLFISFLVDLGKEFKPKPVLFITSDLYLLSVLKHRSILETVFHVPYSTLEIVEKLVDKTRFYKILKKLNIPHAETHLPKNPKDLINIAAHLNYPFIIKAVHANNFSKKFGNKCLKINTKEEMITRYQEAYKIDKNLIVQKELSGTERYLVCIYMNRQSIPLAVCCYQKIRIVPIDYGNAVVCKTIWEPEAVDICVSVLKALNFSGLAEGEVQRDELDGKLKLTEINARSTTEARLSEKCGMNMEYLAYQDAIGTAKPIGISTSKSQDVVWIDIFGDIRAVFSKDGYLPNGKITIPQWIKSLSGKKAFAYFNVSDSYPFFIMLWRFFRTFIFKKEKLNNLWAQLKRSIYH
ncbi:MAG: hypothetical protein L3J69_02830 [Desulfobacula sp.]|nr:hypothetical protein [Desulfobacula sp.]